MTRPTRERVDAALEQAAMGCLLPPSCLVLAAEVRALRAELEAERSTPRRDADGNLVATRNGQPWWFHPSDGWMRGYPR